MADLKQRISRHLQSAGQWLKKAEQSFDQQGDIRAELDLMLAEAELRHAREVKRSGEWRYKYRLLRHGFAFGLAVMVAVGGLGGTLYIVQRQDVQPSAAGQRLALPSAAPGQLLAPDRAAAGSLLTDEWRTPAAVEFVKPQATKPANAVAVTASEHRTAPVYEQRPPREAADRPLDLPPAEMQKLMRAAGKSLRGQ